MLPASNRFCAIVFYTRYEDIFSTKRSRFYFLFCFIFVFAMQVPFLGCKYIKQEKFEYAWLNCWYYDFFDTMDKIFVSFAVFTLAGFYIVAYFASKKQMQALYQSGHASKERRFLYQGSISSITLIAVTLVSAAYMFESSYCDFWKKASLFVLILNFSINPFVYLCFNSVLRRYFFNTILCRKTDANGFVVQ